MNRHLDRCAITPYGRGAGSSRVRVYKWPDRIGRDLTVGGCLSLPDASEASPLSRGWWERRLPRSAESAVHDFDDAPLADRASRFQREVVVIPSCVDLADHEPKISYAPHDPPRLGWIGSPHNEASLLLTADALTEVHRRTDARLTLVGTTTPSPGPLESFIDRIAWSPDSRRTAPAALDIGPLP